MFSNKDPITRGQEKYFKWVFQAAPTSEVVIEDAGHFLQEDKGASEQRSTQLAAAGSGSRNDAGEELARHVVEFVGEGPLPRHRLF